MPKRPLAPMTTAQAKEAALLSMAEIIESSTADDVERFKLRTTFIALCLTLRAQKVLTSLLLKHPDWQDRLRQVSEFLDEQMALDPEHFLHAVLNTPEPEANQ